MKAIGGAFYAIQIPLLDGIDTEELAAAPVQYVDGRHDHYDRAPVDRWVRGSSERRIVTV